MNTQPETRGPIMAAEIRHARIPLDQIEADVRQVRSQFEPKSLRKLADSLLADGLLQPILVFEENGRHIVIAGERRLRAARLAELTDLDCVVFPQRPTPSEITRVQILENVLREGLDPIEKANGFRLVMEQEGLQANQLAERLHLAASTVSRALMLLELPLDLQEQIQRGSLIPAVAREVSRLPEEERRREALSRIKAEKLTSGQAARLVTAMLRPKKAKAPRKNRKTYKLTGYEAVITPARVMIAPTGAKRGRTPDEMLAALEQLLERLREEMASPAAVRSASLIPSIH